MNSAFFSSLIFGFYPFLLPVVFFHNDDLQQPLVVTNSDVVEVQLQSYRQDVNGEPCVDNVVDVSRSAYKQRDLLFYAYFVLKDTSNCKLTYVSDTNPETGLPLICAYYHSLLTKPVTFKHWIEGKYTTPDMSNRSFHKMELIKIPNSWFVRNCPKD